MEYLIAALAIVAVFSIPITAIIMDSRNKRSRDRLIEKAIERGVDDRELRRLVGDGETETKRHRPYRAGLIMIAVGGALLAVSSNWLGAPDEWNHGDEGTMRTGGTIVLFIGIALFLSDLLSRKARKEEQERDRERD